MHSKVLIESAGFTITGLIFLISIGIFYLTRRNKNSINKITAKPYVFMYLDLLFIATVEILYTLSQTGKLNLDVKALCYSYTIASIAWFSAALMYVLSIYFPNVMTNKKKHAICLTFGILLFLVNTLLTFYIHDFKYTSYVGNSQIYAIGGESTKPIYISGLFMLLVLIACEIGWNKRIPKFQRTPLAIASIYIIAYAFIEVTSFTIDFNDFTFVLIFITVLFFITMESQDYQLIKELEESKNATLQASKEKMNFLSTVSHEIKTPMNTIIGLSNILKNQDEIKKEDIKEDAKTIYESSVYLGFLTENLTNLYNLTTKKIIIENKAFNKEEIDTFFNAYRKNIINEHIDFELNNNIISNELKGDIDKINEIIILVTDAAVHYTRSGTIKIDINELDNKLNIVITNPGLDMNEEIFNKKIEDFLQNNSVIDNSELSLLIAKSYLEIIKGSISFEQTENNETIYTIEIEKVK